jgi:large repetitive protein
MRRRTTYAFLLSLLFVSIQLLGCGGGGSSPITINPTVPATGTVGAGYLGTASVTGGSGSYMWAVTGLPPGVMASGTTTATLTISGTPTTAGTSAFSATVTDSKGHTAMFAVSIVISAATPTITITGTLPATGTVGTAYTGSLTASGGTAPYMWVVTGLPTGVAPGATGSPTVTVSGTPTAAGTFMASATVTDAAANTATFNVSVVISAAAANLSVRLPAGYPLSATVGTPYSAPAPTVTGGTAPYTFIIAQNGIPGLTINSTTGAITGTPTKAGTFKPTIEATDSANPANIGFTNFTLVVGANGGSTITIGPATLGTLTNGTAATPTTLTATSTTAPYSWSVTSGSLPAGLVLNNGTTTNTLSITSTTNTITITGTPTATGPYSFTLSITDSSAPVGSGSQAYSGTVSAAVSAACAPPASGTLTTRGNEAALTNLPFAFVLRGADNTDLPVAWAGSFTADGSGRITAADIDFIGRTAGPENLAVQIAGSSYSYGADGRGCLYLAFSADNGAVAPASANANPPLKHGNARKELKLRPDVLANVGTVTFSFSLNASAESGRITEFDLINSEVVAAGQMHQQIKTDFALANLAANFAFGFDGWVNDGTGLDRAAIAGSFANAAGALSGGTADDNIGGLASGILNGGSGSLGTPSGSTGRGTGSYTLFSPGGPTFHFAYYVVNRSDLFIISSDNPGTMNSFILSGRALKASVPSVALSGFYIAATTGLDPNAGGAGKPGNVVTIATLEVTGATIPTATTYTNDGGTFAPHTFTGGSIALDTATGRTVISSIGGPIAYLTAVAADDDIAAFGVGTDAFASSGFLEVQSATTPNFTNADVAGEFAFGTAEDVVGLAGSAVGTYVFDGLGGYTATGDFLKVAGSVSSPNLTTTGTYTVNPDGSGNLDTNKEAFVTNGKLILAVDDTNVTTQPFLYIFIQ